MEALAKLGIDGWGVFLYLVNFGVLLILMKRFVYKPLVKMLDERRKRIKTDVEQATQLRKELEEKTATEETDRLARQATLDQQVAEAKKTAREAARTLLSDANTQRDAILTQASAQADETIAGAMKGAEAEILQRIKTVVMEVLEDGVPEELAVESVKKSWASLSKN